MSGVYGKPGFSRDGSSINSPPASLTNGVAESFNRTLKEQIVAQYAGSSHSTIPVARGEERLAEPRSGPLGVGRGDVTQARRMRHTCIQGTGCDKEIVGSGEFVLRG